MTSIVSKYQLCNDSNEAKQVLSELRSSFDKIGGIDECGYALSAPQIGILKSVALFRSIDREIAWINPEIVDAACVINVSERFLGSKYKKERFQEFVVRNSIISEHGSFESRLEYYYLDDRYLGTDIYSQCFCVQQMIDLLAGIPVGKSLIDVGRNSLCLCGSGKKYKKCCISI